MQESRVAASALVRLSGLDPQTGEPQTCADPLRGPSRPVRVGRTVNQLRAQSPPASLARRQVLLQSNDALLIASVFRAPAR